MATEDAAIPGMVDNVIRIANEGIKGHLDQGVRGKIEILRPTNRGHGGSSDVSGGATYCSEPSA